MVLVLNLQPTNGDVLRSKGPTSPVAIIPSRLPESFYSADPQQHSPSRRIISPSLPFTHPVSAKDIQFPAVAAAALKAPSSALSGAFFGGASEATSTREIIDETADRKVAQVCCTAHSTISPA